MQKNNKLFLTILYFILLIINFFVGINLKEPSHFFTIFSIVFILFYCFFYRKDIKILDNKLDIFVILFLLLPLIPFIFNTYISLGNNYNSLERNVSLLCIYIFIKNLNINKEKLISVLIFASIPVLIISFDRLYFNIIWNFISKLDIFNVSYLDDGVIGNFNYPNSLACYLSCLFVLVLYKLCLNKENKIRFIYLSLSFILLLLIVLTESKGLFLVLGIALILYLFLIKKFDNKLNVILTLLFDFLCILIYLFLNNIFIISSIINVIILVVLVGLLFVFDRFLFKFLSNFINNINKNNLLYLFIILPFLFVIYYFISINISSSKVFNTSEIIKLKGFEKSDTYTISVDLYTDVRNKDLENFSISIYSIDRNSYREKEVIEMISNYDGIINLEVLNPGDLFFLELRVNKLSSEKNNKLIIRNVKINNEDYIINYKYIPNKLVNIIKSFSFGEENVSTRFTYFKDAFKLIKNNFLLGSGGDSWMFLYKSIRSYSYYANNVHNFYIDIFISYGVIGFAVLIILLFYLLKYMTLSFKKNKEYLMNISIFTVLFILLTHSMIDFDMSFLLINVLFFYLISLVSKDFKIIKDNVYLKNIFTVSMFVFLIIYSLNFFGVLLNYTNEKNINTSLILYPTSSKLRYKHVLDETNNSYNINSETLDDVIYFLEYEPYYNFNFFSRILINYLDNEYKSNTLDKELLQYTYSLFYKYKLSDKYDLVSICARLEIMIDFYNIYNNFSINYNDEEMKKKSILLKDKILDEFDIYLEDVSNYKKTPHAKYFYNKYLAKFNELKNNFSNEFEKN